MRKPFGAVKRAAHGQKLEWARVREVEHFRPGNHPRVGRALLKLSPSFSRRQAPAPTCSYSLDGVGAVRNSETGEQPSDFGASLVAQERPLNSLRILQGLDLPMAKTA